MTNTPIIVPMEDGTQYLIQPRTSRRGKPEHRVYRIVNQTPWAKHGTQVRVTDEGELAKVAQRLTHMANVERQNAKREKRFPKPLVYIWRWIMVFLDTFRARRKA